MNREEHSKPDPTSKRARQSPQKSFAARVELIQFELLRLGFEKHIPLLGRLCIDDRMQPAWHLLACLDDDLFEDLIWCVIVTNDWIKNLPNHRLEYQAWRYELDEATLKTRNFIKMCESLPVFMPVGERLDRYDGPFTIEQCFPELVTRAREALLALEAERPIAAVWEKEDVGHLSRKFGDGRVETARDLAPAVENITGKPNWEVLTALINVILDTDVDNQVSVEAVRKAVARRPDN